MIPTSILLTADLAGTEGEIIPDLPERHGLIRADGAVLLDGIEMEPTAIYRLYPHPERAPALIFEAGSSLSLRGSGVSGYEPIVIRMNSLAEASAAAITCTHCMVISVPTPAHYAAIEAAERLGFPIESTWRSFSLTPGHESTGRIIDPAVAGTLLALLREQRAAALRDALSAPEMAALIGISPSRVRQLAPMVGHRLGDHGWAFLPEDAPLIRAARGSVGRPPSGTIEGANNAGG